MRKPHADRGAVAVEFALVFPFMLIMLLATLGFGHYFYVQSTLANAARDAVRTYTIAGDPDPDRTLKEQAIDRAIESASVAITIAPEQVYVTPDDCTRGPDEPVKHATVSIIAKDVTLLGGIVTLDLAAAGTMRCAG